MLEEHINGNRKQRRMAASFRRSAEYRNFIKKQDQKEIENYEKLLSIAKKQK